MPCSLGKSCYKQPVAKQNQCLISVKAIEGKERCSPTKSNTAQFNCYNVFSNKQLKHRNPQFYQHGYSKNTEMACAISNSNHPTTASYTFRTPTSEDYTTLIPELNAWFGGRDMIDMLPRLFFTHFCSTSLIAEHPAPVDSPPSDSETAKHNIAGFLIGFISPFLPDLAYTHFIGVSPNHWGRGLGRQLYSRFFDIAAAAGCTKVRSVTSPTNTKSLAFHKALGFEHQGGDREVHNEFGRVVYYFEYDGPGRDRVVQEKTLS